MNIEQLLPAKAAYSMEPANFEEALKFAELIANSDLVPKDFKGKPGNVLVAIQLGREIGLKAMQSLQNISVINGRPSVWGDALWGLIKAHPLCEWTSETFDDMTMTASCTVKRKGAEAVTRTFSKADAEKALLWTKEVWKGYPKRMLQMRARGFACRDAIPEALKGLYVAEEAQDMPVERDVTPMVEMPRAIEQPANKPKAPPESDSVGQTPINFAETDSMVGETVTVSNPVLHDAQEPTEVKPGTQKMNTGYAGPLASQAQQAIVQKKMQHANKTDGDLLRDFGFLLESMPESRVHDVMKWAS